MKKVSGVSRTWSSYVSIKKHKCPKCGCLLKTVESSKVVDPSSQKVDSSKLKVGYSNYLVGPVKIISKEFECHNCGNHLTVDELKASKGILSNKSLTKEERKKSKRHKNVINILLAVLVGIIVFIIYSLIKASV